MKLSSNDLKVILQGLGRASRYVSLDVDNVGGIAHLEHQVRFWLQWNLSCVRQGFIGHDKDIQELRLRLRLINRYKNELAKEELAKGF